MRVCLRLEGSPMRPALHFLVSTFVVGFQILLVNIQQEFANMLPLGHVSTCQISVFVLLTLES